MWIKPQCTLTFIEMFFLTSPNPISAVCLNASPIVLFISTLVVSTYMAAAISFDASIPCSVVIGILCLCSRMSSLASNLQPHSITGVVGQCNRISGFH